MREARIAAVFAFVAAVAAATVGVSHFMMPRAQLHFATGVTPAFFESLAADSGAFRIHYGAFVVAALASMALVLGVRRLIVAPRPLLYSIAEVWGLVGLSVAAIDFALMRSKALSIAAVFGGLDAGAQSSVIAIGLPRLDPMGLFSFGLFGLFLAAFSWTARRALGSVLPWLGMLGALLYWTGFVGSVTHQPILVDIGAGFGAVIVAPLWSAWMGIVLWRIRGNATS